MSKRVKGANGQSEEEHSSGKKARCGDPVGEYEALKRQMVAATPAPDAPRYEFQPLIAASPELRRFAFGDSQGSVRIDFRSREATAALTRAILKYHFNLSLFLPANELVPTVPNRVQYLTWASSLLGRGAADASTVALDIGTGPSCIYAMLGTRLFPKWTFIATDTDPHAVQAARRNCTENKLGNIKVIETELTGQLLPEEVQSAGPVVTVCNPPFHEAVPTKANRAGTAAQLATEGGEYAFLQKLALESKQCVSVEWFTSLIGRKVDLPRIVAYLRSPTVRALHVKTVVLSQGGRTTRWAVAWSYGPERSTATVVDPQSSKWRLTVAVRPGRQFANELEVGDIVSTFRLVLCGWDWTETEGQSQIVHNKIVMEGPDDDEYRQTQLECVATGGDGCGKFEAVVKVVQRGAMCDDTFRVFGTRLAGSVAAFLNGETS